MSDINDAIEEFIDELLEKRGVVTTDNLREAMEEERAVFEGELPDFDDFVSADALHGLVSESEVEQIVEHSNTGLDEDGIVDLMRSYHPGGCRTARAANDMLGSWLEGVLDGTLDEQADRLNEHIRAVVAAALLPQEPHIEERIVEVQAEVGEQWFVLVTRDDDAQVKTQPPVGPFADYDGGVQWLHRNQVRGFVYLPTAPVNEPVVTVE